MIDDHRNTKNTHKFGFCNLKNGNFEETDRERERERERERGERERERERKERERKRKREREREREKEIIYVLYMRYPIVFVRKILDTRHIESQW